MKTNQSLLRNGKTVVLALAMLVSLTGCKNNNRRKLEKMDITFTAESFVEYAGEGNFEVVELFLASGMDVNARSSDGETALIAATKGGYVKIIELLDGKGADLDMQDETGETARGWSTPLPCLRNGPGPPRERGRPGAIGAGRRGLVGLPEPRLQPQVSHPGRYPGHVGLRRRCVSGRRSR